MISPGARRGRGRARLRPSRGFPVGFATTHEPNRNAAISTSCSDCNGRQTDWTRSLVFQTQPGLTSCLWPHQSSSRVRSRRFICGFKAFSSSIYTSMVFIRWQSQRLQFGHFETIKPGEILDFSLGKSFLFFLLASQFRSV